MAAGAAHMMRTALLTAIGAFIVGRNRQRVVRTAHVALGRRSFSFRHRHGGTLLKARKTGTHVRPKAGASPSVGGQSKARSEQQSPLGFKPEKPAEILEKSGISGRFSSF
jgi:hypothetical protein